MTVLSFFVPGNAAPQGSKNFYRGRAVESSKALGPWREAVRWECRRVAGPTCLYPQGVPVAVVLEFIRPRPASTPKRRTPPAVKMPDLDKMVRAVCDAIGSSGAWHDDSQVTELQATKRLAEIGEVPGVHVFIRPTVAEAAA